MRKYQGGSEGQNQVMRAQFSSYKTQMCEKEDFLTFSSAELIFHLGPHSTGKLILVNSKFMW